MSSTPSLSGWRQKACRSLQKEHTVTAWGKSVDTAFVTSKTTELVWKQITLNPNELPKKRNDNISPQLKIVDSSPTPEIWTWYGFLCSAEGKLQVVRNMWQKKALSFFYHFCLWDMHQTVHTYSPAHFQQIFNWEDDLSFYPEVGTSGSAALGVSAWITSWSLWSDPRIHNLTQKQKWHQMSQDLATKTTSDALSLRHCGFTWTFDSSNHVLWIHFNPEEHTYEKVFEQLWWMFYLFRGIFSKASALMTNI